MRIASTFRRAGILIAATVVLACSGGEQPPAPAPAPSPAPAAQGAAPNRRPTPQIETTTDLSGVTAQGGVARLIARVTLPPELHVQANKPRDPALIPTELTVTPPAGTTLVDITYPEPIDFDQAGATQPLAVYPNVFEIVVRLKVPRGLTETAVTGALRYQACNDVLCFAPATADVMWSVGIPRT